MSRSFMLALLLLLSLFLASNAWSAPKVVVSIKPVHSLVANLMAGVGTPTLLVNQGGSPHGYAMRPSEARALHQADLLIWVGPELESFLEKPLSASTTRHLQLTASIPDQFLPIRAGGQWQKHAHHHHDHQTERDPHLWLGIDQAQQICAATVAALSDIDPGNQVTYRANGAALQQRLANLESELARTLAPIKKTPYIVFHDAYQYFEASFGLNAVGSVAIDPERRPGVRRILEIRQRIKELGARCVFSEPQFEPRLVATVIEGTGAVSAALDPIGADLEQGPEAYFELMHNLGEALVKGLSLADATDRR